MIITSKKRSEGETLPPFFYGLAYTDWNKSELVYYPIPINYLIMLGMSIRIYWNRFRAKRTWIDKQISVGIIDYVDRFDNNIEKAIERRLELAIKLNAKVSDNESFNRNGDKTPTSG